MERFLNVSGKIIAIVVLILFIFNLTMFASTDDLKYGIWAILLSLSMHVSGKIEVTVKER